MTDDAKLNGRRMKWPIIVGFTVATLLGVWVLTDVLWLELDNKRRVFRVLGATALAFGTFWIGALITTNITDLRARWLALIGPLGAIQVFSGLTLLLWTGGFGRLSLVAASGALTCTLIFMVWPWRRPPPENN